MDNFHASLIFFVLRPGTGAVRGFRGLRDSLSVALRPAQILA